MRRFRPSAAMVVALGALFVALGGTGYAALSLPKNSVGSKQLKKNSVTSRKVKDGTLLLADFKASQRALLKGDKGDPGNPGATLLYAEVSAGASPAVLSGAGVTGVAEGSNFYVVTFNRDVSQCVPFGTTTGTNGNNSDDRISVVHRSGGATQLNVRTYTGAAGTADITIPFSVAVMCP